MMIEDRFMEKVRIIPCGGCWEWTASLKRDGYGQYRFDGTMRLAHRLAYEWLVGPIPEGLGLDHLCRNRSCVNPAHLEPVTQWENVLRGQTIPAANAAKTHCPQGHEYAPENTFVYRDSRYCRECGRVRARKNYRRKKSMRQRQAKGRSAS